MPDDTATTPEAGRVRMRRKKDGFITYVPQVAVEFRKALGYVVEREPKIKEA